MKRPQQQTVILANGAYPRARTPAREILDGATRVVACDGAANAYRRRTGRWPTLIVGDLDSFARTRQDAPGTKRILACPEQETNDLEKAVRACRARGWDNLVIVGATGKREDHTLGNIFRAFALGVEIVTDEGRLIPVATHLTLPGALGTGVSIFADDPATRVVSTGLEWPLDEVRFTNLYCATLNRVSAPRVTLRTTRPILVFIQHPPVKARTKPCRTF